MNVTDMVIHFSDNNTAIFIDASTPAIIALNLDYPVIYPNSTAKTFENYFRGRFITTTTRKAMSQPKYLALDDWAYLVLWSDYSLMQVTCTLISKPRVYIDVVHVVFVVLQISYDRYRTIADDLYSPGTAFGGRDGHYYQPVGLAVDRALGIPQWSNYLECYGNGRCEGIDGKWMCSCYEGYFGDCQARTCPKGRAWFLEPAVDNVAHDEFVECSNMGVCDRGTGKCTCQTGFEGGACERMSCPHSTGNTCFGRGRCLSMRQLGYYHKDKYLDPDPVLYGSKANDPLTWDADMIFGCLPDEYGSMNGIYNVSNPTGPFLDTYICPQTYNPRYRDLIQGNISSKVPINQTTMAHEIQYLTCDAHSGSFKLSFRGMVSDFISTNATKADFISALQAIPTVGRISVVYSDHSLCSESGTFGATVTFLDRLGNIPLLKAVDVSRLVGGSANIFVERLQASSAVGIFTCAGKGNCNSVTGRCECFSGYGTSDGFGNPGVTGDCGSSIIV
jgi:hypothetical protein